MVNHLRAALILLHLVAITALCIPAPVGGLNQRTYDDPNIRKTFEDYAGVLQSAGIDVAPLALQDLAWERGADLIALRKAAIDPFETYYRLTGTFQGWRMFGYVNRKPARIELHLQRTADAPWEPLYIARSDEHDWRREQLDQERFRGLLNSFSHGRSRGRYRQVVRWFSDQVRADLPDAHALRVRMVPLPMPPPERLRTLGEIPTGRPFWSTEVDLKRPQGGAE